MKVPALKDFHFLEVDQKLCATTLSMMFLDSSQE